MRAAFFTLTTLAAAALLAAATPADAQVGLLDVLDRGRPSESAPRGASAQRAAEYERQIGELTPRQIIQQKAQIRAAQRMDRIAAMEWYGHSKARPKTTGTPFTGLYGAQFQGHTYGRPAAHYAARPVIVITK